MKKIILLAAVFLCGLLPGLPASAQIRFINADGSALGDICIAAVESRKTVNFLLEELGLKPSDAKSIRCNGQSLRGFASRYSQDDDYQEYIFNVGDASPETKLCIAAISSDFMVDEVKLTFFSEEPGIESQVRCNGMSLQKFTGKYKNHMTRRRVSMN